MSSWCWCLQCATSQRAPLHGQRLYAATGRDYWCDQINIVGQSSLLCPEEVSEWTARTRSQDRQQLQQDAPPPRWAADVVQNRDAQHGVAAAAPVGQIEAISDCHICCRYSTCRESQQEVLEAAQMRTFCRRHNVTRTANAQLLIVRARQKLQLGPGRCGAAMCGSGSTCRVAGVQPPRSDVREAGAAVAAEHGQVSTHAEVLAIAAANVGNDGAAWQASQKFAHPGPHREPGRSRYLHCPKWCRARAVIMWHADAEVSVGPCAP